MPDMGDLVRVRVTALLEGRYVYNAVFLGATSGATFNEELAPRWMLWVQDGIWRPMQSNVELDVVSMTRDCL